MPFYIFGMQGEKPLNNKMFEAESEAIRQLAKHTLDFVLHRLLGGLAEMDTDDIGGLANLLSDSRASGGVGCSIVHSKSSCK